MPTECSRDLFGFAPVEGREVVAAFDGGAITSDAGALLLGATDRAIGMMNRFAARRPLSRHRSTEIEARQARHSARPVVVNTLKEWKLSCPKTDQGLVFPTARGQITDHKSLQHALAKAQIESGVITGWRAEISWPAFASPLLRQPVHQSPRRRRSGATGR
jgi:hypothetical protein